MRKKILQYKFLRKGNKSENGKIAWKLNKWVKAKGELKLCQNGLHSSKEPYDAFSYVQGQILALVECRGEHLKDENKYCWREQRVIKTYRWTKRDSLKLAIFSAELCLKNFEKEFPNDLRPRQAIEAAKKVLFKDTKENRDAAESAFWSAARSAESAAWSAAWSAESAFWSAAWSAESAAWSAESAAWSAAWSAESAARSAAWSAESAARSAWSAAESATEFASIRKIQRHFKKIVKEKENV